VDKNGLEKVEDSVGFVKIIQRENGNFDLALRKRRFCTVKAALLQRKTYAFGM